MELPNRWPDTLLGSVQQRHYLFCFKRQLRLCAERWQRVIGVEVGQAAGGWLLLVLASCVRKPGNLFW
jgi:hypothetical protein